MNLIRQRQVALAFLALAGLAALLAGDFLISSVFAMFIAFELYAYRRVREPGDNAGSGWLMAASLLSVLAGIFWFMPGVVAQVSADQVRSWMTGLGSDDAVSIVLISGLLPALCALVAWIVYVIRSGPPRFESDVGRGDLSMNMDRRPRRTADEWWLLIAAAISLVAGLLFLAALLVNALSEDPGAGIGVTFLLYLAGGTAIIAALPWIVYLVLRLRARSWTADSIS